MTGSSDGRSTVAVGEVSRARLSRALDAYLPYLMVAPALLLAGGLLVYPLFWAVWLSFHRVPIYAPEATDFAGLTQYRSLLTDPFVHDVLVNTIVFVGASIAGQFVLGLGLALLLNQDWLGERLTRSFRASFILPWTTSGVVVAYSWVFMLDDRVGLVNRGLHAVGVASPPTWTNSLELAMLAVVIANVWRGVPFSLVLQTSALESVRQRSYEAAAVAGASRLQTVRHVVLPQLRPFLLMNLALITVFTLSVFDIIYVMTGGGPIGRTEVLALHMYESAFELGHLGRGSALAVVLFALNLAVVAIYLVAIREGEREGAGEGDR